MLQLATTTGLRSPAGRLLAHVRFFGDTHHLRLGHSAGFMQESGGDDLATESALDKHHLAICKASHSTAVGGGVVEFQFERWNVTV